MVMRRNPARSRQRAEVAVPSDPVDDSEAVSPGADLAPADAPPALPLPSDPEELLGHYRQRVLANGHDVEARHELGRLHAARGELQQAAEQYEAARAVAPEDPRLLLEYAETQIALRRFDVAERELRRLLKLFPENGGAYLQLGIASLRRGLYAQAEQELRRAVELLPASAAGYFYRGEALNQLERMDEALEMLERAAQLDPENARAFYVMGILYDKKGRPQEAAALYRKAREVAGT